MSQVAKSELMELFSQEVSSYLPEIVQNINGLVPGKYSSERINELHRLFHNIKGSAALVGRNNLSEGARLVEQFFENLVLNELPVPGNCVHGLKKTVQLIEMYISRTDDNGEDIYQQITELFKDQTSVSAESSVKSDDQWQVSLRSLFPLFEDLAECTSENVGDIEHNRIVFSKLGQAVSIVIACVKAEGLADRYRILNDFHQLFRKVIAEPGNYCREVPGLISDFLQFLDMMLERESLDAQSRLSAETGEAGEDDVFESALEADIFSSVDGADDTLAFMEELPETDLSDDERVSSESAEVDEEQQLLFDVFQAECDEHLTTINSSLNDLEREITEKKEITSELRENVSEMRRAVHTLKGAAAMTSVNLLARAGHVLEDMLDWLHDEAETIAPEDVDILASGVDVMEFLAQSPEASESSRLVRFEEEIRGHFSLLTGENELSGEFEPESVPVGFEDGVSEEVSLPEETGTLRVRLDELDELVSIEGELVVARGAMESMLDELSETLVELDNVKNNLRRKSQELESGFEVQSLYGFNPVAAGEEHVPGHGGDLDEFDPIELDRYSQLNLIIRSLNEISVDVNSIYSTMTSLAGDLRGQVGKQQLTMRLMQDKLMRIRMTPLSSISRFLFRTVRDTARRLGKNVNLNIIGEDVYMDRFVWAKMMDPLMHILRNCVDHGIESTERRMELGKDETGSIVLEAEQRSRFVVLRISDDGSGIDLDLVREKLKAEGLVDAPELLDDEELFSWLFRPSFTTKEDVSQISGRGVGLDVVRRNIQELRGTVRLVNSPDGGAVFEFQIPFTLSVNRAIMISVAGGLFAVPLQEIIEVNHFSLDELEDKEVVSVQWNEEKMTVENLGFYLRPGVSHVRPETTSEGILAIIFQDAGGDLHCVSIDSVVEQREIIVKDFGSHLTHVHGVSGVTVTPSGSLVPILNLSELVENAVEQPDSGAEVHTELNLSEPLKVLIVDDSISVRHSVARLIESKSWKQRQAVDGLDALAQLESFMPDVIVLDIEMPRMNGYELKSNLNSHGLYRDIPVVMLTSRSSEKHREKARELGVEHYLTKPYQEETFIRLLEKIGSK
ncbi:response regulator [Desulfomarina sp.]